MQQFTNKYEVPLPLALWLTTDDYQFGASADEISATALIRSPRYIIGSRRQMYPEQFPEHLRLPSVADVELPDIQSRIASRVGTAIHEAVEKAWLLHHKEGLEALGYPSSTVERVTLNPDLKEPDKLAVYMENRLYKDIEVGGKKFTISGQYDMIVNGNLHDIKTTGTYSYETGTNDDKYTLQGSIYRWLNPELITGDTLTINFLFLDWKQFMSKPDDSYPPAKAYFKKYPLMSLQDTEAYIRNKLKQLAQYWDMPLDSIPCCTPQELFKQPPVFKYYKEGYKDGARSTKNFKTFAEASAYRADKGKHQGDIIEHKGKPYMCSFCNPDEVEALSTHTNKPMIFNIG